MPATITEICSEFSPVYARSSLLHHSCTSVRCQMSSLPKQKYKDAGICQRLPASLYSSVDYIHH